MTCRLKSWQRSRLHRARWTSALAALAEDHAFLLKGDVFTKDVIDMWIEYKTEQ